MDTKITVQGPAQNLEKQQYRAQHRMLRNTSTGPSTEPWEKNSTGPSLEPWETPVQGPAQNLEKHQYRTQHRTLRNTKVKGCFCWFLVVYDCMGMHYFRSKRWDWNQFRAVPWIHFWRKSCLRQKKNFMAYCEIIMKEVLVMVYKTKTKKPYKINLKAMAHSIALFFFFFF